MTKENDFEVLINFSKRYRRNDSELKISLTYTNVAAEDICREVIEGQLYQSYIDFIHFSDEGAELLPLVESKIIEFDRIIQKLNLWYIFRISKKDKCSNYISCKINTSNLNKEQLIEDYFKLFLGGGGNL